MKVKRLACVSMVVLALLVGGCKDYNEVFDTNKARAEESLYKQELVTNYSLNKGTVYKDGALGDKLMLCKYEYTCQSPTKGTVKYYVYVLTGDDADHITILPYPSTALEVNFKKVKEYK